MIKLNEQDINVTLFPDNTSQVWNVSPDTLYKFSKTKRFAIDWNFTHEGEIIHLAQLVTLLRNIEPTFSITLHMDFLPYGRQDKGVANDKTFGLITFANLINSLEFDMVTTFDAHSDAPDYLIKNFKNLFPYTLVEGAVNKCNPDMLAFPDKGAIRRYGKELAFLGKIHVYGDKERDQQTGHITNYTLHGDVSGRNVLIVDDICDGGMTFIHLAKALLTNGAKSVNLYTTHGIYSKGLRPLREAKIERIFNKAGEVGEIQGHITIQEY